MNVRKKIALILIIAFLNAIISPLLLRAQSNFTTFKMEDERKEYQLILRNESASLMNTPLQVYRDWYVFGKNYFPFGLKTATFVDTALAGAKFIKKLLNPKYFLPGMEVFGKLKSLFGGIIDIVGLTNKTKLIKYVKFLKYYRIINRSEQAALDLEKINSGAIFKAVYRSFKSGFVDLASHLYLNRLSPGLKAVFKGIKESQVWIRLSKISSIEKYASKVPLYLAKFGKICNSFESAAKTKIAKVGKLFKSATATKVGKGISKGIKVAGHVANALDGITRVLTIKDAIEDKAFNTVSDGKAIFASIKLVAITGSYIPVIGVVFKVIDALLSLGEMFYCWWAERHEPINLAISNIEGSEWEQYKELFDKIYSSQFKSNTSVFQKVVEVAESSAGGNPVIDYDYAGDPKMDFDFDKFVSMKSKSFEAMSNYLDNLCKVFYGTKSDGKTPNWPIDKSVYQALAFASKAIPSEDTLDQDQIKEKNNFLKQIALAGFYQKYLLSGRIDYYIKKNAANIGDEAGWWDTMWENEDYQKKQNFKRRYPEFKDIHFKLIKQPAYVVLGRFMDFRKKYQADKNNSSTKELVSPLAAFHLGYYYYLFEYERILKNFKTWDIYVVDFANRCRFFFNLCDDIKIHNELIKHGRDEIDNLVDNFKSNSWYGNSIDEDKKFRNASDEVGIVSFLIRGTCCFIADYLHSNIDSSSGKFTVTSQDIESRMNKFEEIAIKHIYNNTNVIKHFLTTFEAKNEKVLWVFNSGVTQTIKGEELAPIPKDWKLNIPNIAFGYIREFFILWQIYANTIAGYNIVLGNRNAIMGSTCDLIKNVLGKDLTGEAKSVYDNKVKRILWDYYAKSKRSMDNESDSELVSKFSRTSDNAMDNMKKWFADSKIVEKISTELKWYHAVIEKLKAKLDELNSKGKIFNFYIYYNVPEFRTFSFNKGMITSYPLISTNKYADNVIKNAVFNKLISSGIRGVRMDQIKIESKTSCGYDFILNKGYYDIRGPIFIFIEKDSDSQTGKDVYKLHTVY